MSALATHRFCPSCGAASVLPPTHSQPRISCDVYDSLATSNDPATDNEARVVRDVLRPNIQSGIQTLEKGLDHLEALIAPLLGELNRLKSEKARLEAMDGQCRGLLSAMRRLPAETLTEIFQWTCADAGDPEGTSIFTTSAGPWALSQVCRHWRHLAHSTPTLWASFTLGIPDNIPSDWYPILSTVISLTGQCLLSFSFSESPTDDKRAREVLDYLTKYSSRWKDLSLYAGKDILLSLERAQCDFSSLESLRIRMPDWCIARITSAFQSAPLLRHVALCGFDRHAILLPFSQLTSVKLSYSYTNSTRLFHRFLSECPLLASMEVRYTAGDDAAKVSEANVGRSELSSPVQYLDLDATNTPSQLSFTAPALVSLRLHGLTGLSPLLDFVDRSQCRLQSLDLEVNVSPVLLEQVWKLCALVPTVEEFQIALFYSPDDEHSEGAAREAYRTLVDSFDREVIMRTLPNVAVFVVYLRQTAVQIQIV